MKPRSRQEEPQVEPQNQNNKKKEIIHYLSENMSSPFGRNVVDLCNILIDEFRALNDDARGDEILVNQGGIRGLKALIKSLTKKLPEEQKGRMVIDS